MNNIQIDNKKINYVYTNLSFYPKTYFKDTYITISVQTVNELNNINVISYKKLQIEENEYIYLNLQNIKTVSKLCDNYSTITFKNGKYINIKTNQFLKDLQK